MRKNLLFLILAAASPVSAQSSGPARHLNLFATAWVGATTEPFEDQFPLSPQLGIRLELIPGRVSAGIEGTLDLVRSDSDGVASNEREFMKGLTGTARIDLRKGRRRPYLLGFFGKMRFGDQDFRTYGGGVGLSLPDVRWGRVLQVELRYRGDNRLQSADSGRWELGMGLGILR